MTGAGALDLLRPFLWLALSAFLVGLASYLALGHPSQPAAPAKAQPAMATVPGEAVSGPSSDDWNLPKHI